MTSVHAYLLVKYIDDVSKEEVRLFVSCVKDSDTGGSQWCQHFYHVYRWDHLWKVSHSMFLHGVVIFSLQICASIGTFSILVLLSVAGFCFRICALLYILTFEDQMKIPHLITIFKIFNQFVFFVWVCTVGWMNSESLRLGGTNSYTEIAVPDKARNQ